MITIGVLQTGKVGGAMGEEFGEFPDMFKALLGEEDFTYQIYPVVDGTFPSAPSECDAWIVTGSKHGVYEEHAWIPPLENFIRELVKSKVPTMGICFGHQVMAQAMGGTVIKHPSGWGVGVHEYDHHDTDGKVRLLAFHQDQVIKKPESAEVTHSSDFCEFAGLRYHENCFSLQPHPEHTVEFTRALLVERRGAIIDTEVADIALDSLENDNSHPDYAIKLQNFFKSAG